jgi:hypothetical protein
MTLITLFCTPGVYEYMAKIRFVIEKLSEVFKTVVCRQNKYINIGSISGQKNGKTLAQMAKMAKMANNGKKWQKMATNGKKWQQMATNGKKWQKVAKSGKKWQKVAKNGKN